MPTAIVDTHAHLDYLQREQGEDPAVVMERARAEGVEFIVNPCVTPKRFDEVMAIVERLENVYAAVAVHPTDVLDTEEYPDWPAQIEALLQHPKVVALGETGLDYYWSLEHVDLQKQCLKIFLELGRKYDKPVILHDRDYQEPRSDSSSHQDIYDIVSSVPGVRGVMHCFSGDAEFAQKMIEKGFYISFAGNVTFKKATDLQEAAKAVPLEYLLVETDSPFLSPVPFRGKPNEPARVRHVVEKIAELKGLSYEEVAAATTANARKVFALC